MKKMLGLSLLLTAAIMTSGCASFAGGKLETAAVPKVAHYEVKPTAYIDVRFFQGRPDSGVEIPDLKQKIQSIVDGVVRDSNVFSSYTFDAFSQESQDHVVQMYFYNYGDAGAATLLGLISGFSLGVIPAAATDQYSLVSKVQTKGKEPGNPTRSDDEVTTWIGIWFLPFAGNTPEKAATQTFQDLTRDALRQLVESRQLKLYAKKARPATRPASKSPAAPATAAPSTPTP